MRHTGIGFLAAALMFQIATLSCNSPSESSGDGGVRDADEEDVYDPFDTGEEDAFYSCRSELDCTPPELCCYGICSLTCDDTPEDGGQDAGDVGGDIPDKQSECIKDQDCAIGEFCHKGACLVGSGEECDYDEDCPVGEVCADTRCVKSDKVGGKDEPCYSDNTCKGALVCEGGICVEQGDDDDLPDVPEPDGEDDDSGDTCGPCDDPPANICVNANTQREYSAPGVCKNNKCEYPYTDTPCKEGCSLGYCGECEPKCEGKECGPDGCGSFCGGCKINQTCENGQCVCEFELCGATCCAKGQTCYKGACCTVNCAGKECGDNGCGGVCGDNCATAPTATCLDQNTKREYRPNGYCNLSGKCEFMQNDTSCPHGCADGECQACVSSCEGKLCGDDGCGNPCPPGCESDEYCAEDFTCKKGGLKTTPWPMLNRNAKHTAIADVSGPATAPSQKWKYTMPGNLGSTIETPPIIDSDGSAYFMGEKLTQLFPPKIVLCVYGVNSGGGLKWENCSDCSLAGCPGYSTPALISGDSVLFGYKDAFQAFQVGNGKSSWMQSGGNFASSPAVSKGGTIYVGSTDKNLYALVNSPFSPLKWKYATGGSIYSSPAIDDDGVIYVGSDDKSLHAVNPGGTKKWSFNTGGEVRSSPVIGPEGNIYIGSNSKKVFALAPDGSKLWEFADVGWKVDAPLAISPDGSTVFFGGGCWNEQKRADGETYCVEGSAFALNAADGSLKWRFSTGNYVRSSPVVDADGVAYIGCDDEKLYAITPEGTKKWEWKAGRKIRQGIAIGSDGSLYVPAEDVLYVLQ